LPEAVFFAVTIISAGTLILPLWNYTQFYSAWYNFSYTIPRVNINTSQLSRQTAQINLTLVATNPTGYSGLQVQSVSCVMSYNGSVHLGAEGPTNSWELTTLSTTKPYSISPNSNTTILFDITISPNSAPPDQFDAFQQFISYLISQTPGGQIQWSLACSLVLASFLINTPEPTMYFALVTPLS